MLRIEARILSSQTTLLGIDLHPTPGLVELAPGPVELTRAGGTHPVGRWNSPRGRWNSPMGWWNLPMGNLYGGEFVMKITLEKVRSQKKCSLLDLHLS